MRSVNQSTVALATMMIAGILAFRSAAVPAGGGQRVPWTSSKIVGSPEPPRPFILRPVFDKWTTKKPVDVTFVGDWNRVIVLHVDGTWVSFPADGDGTDATPLLDLPSVPPRPFASAYGFTLHPDVQRNRQVFVCYSDKINPPSFKSTQWYLSRFHLASLNPPRIDPDSEEVLITMEMSGHRGGCLKFGPDGYLYVSVGDGRPPSPPDGLKTGQDLTDLRANILRIDVDRSEKGLPYAVPKDNPFVTLDNARPEIWAYGLRNPWRMSFSSFDDSLWLGDVGWEMWELVHRIVKGGNYGWSIFEGSQSVHPDLPRGPTPVRPPVVQHPHTESRSVTGGYVYRGAEFPELRKAYIYGDYVTGKIWALWHDGKSVQKHQEIAHAPVQIISFAEDDQGELLVADFAGRYFRLQRNPQRKQVSSFPKKLSETGLFRSTSGQIPMPGVIPYDLRQGMWTDGAVVQRFIGLPGTEKIGIHKRHKIADGERKGEWKFPADTVFARTVSLPLDARAPENLRKLETQVLHFDGKNWQPYNYLWNDAQTDASLADFKGGDRTLKVIDQEGRTLRKKWHFASRTECMTCHLIRTGGVQGFKDWQLDHAGTSGNQLHTLNRMVLFEKKPSARKVGQPALSPDLTLESGARAYLDVNCAHCHQFQGGGGATIDLRYEADTEKTELLKPPALGTFGIPSPQTIRPGHPAASILYYRMAKLGPGHMPFIGSRQADPTGLKLLRAWISSMPGEPDPRPTDPTMDTLDHWLSSTQNALRLLIHVQDSDPNSKVIRAITKRASRHPNPNVRDLFEAYIPEDQRVPRLGLNIRPGQILSLKGNPDIGRKLFFSEHGTGCASCHQVNGKGTDFGPDLSRVGDRHPRGRILHTILDPNRTLAKGYAAVEVETKNEFAYTGFVSRRTAKQLTLKLPGGKSQNFAAGDIRSVRPLGLSVMPAGLLQNFTAREAADLLAFLGGLKTGSDIPNNGPLKSQQDDRYTHSIPYTAMPINIDGSQDEAAWRKAKPVGAFQFPWEAGENEPTQAKLLWDDDHLYVSFRCTDTMILGEHDTRDSAVYRDDCVEIFLSPDPTQLEKYFNIEMSVTGAWLDHFHPGGVGTKADWDPVGIRLASSVEGTQNIESDHDRSWTIEVAIPFAAFEKVAKQVPPNPGDEWRLNLNRLNFSRPSGHNRLQRSQWAPSHSDKLGFHAPEFFGKVIFSKE